MVGERVFNNLQEIYIRKKVSGNDPKVFASQNIF